MYAILDSSGEQEMVTVTYALFVALLLGHLGLAFWVGLTTHWRQAWKLLIGLSVLTNIVWFFLGAAITLRNMMAVGSDWVLSAINAYGYTFGMPYGLKIHWWYENTILLAALYVLALLSYAFGKVLSQK